MNTLTKLILILLAVALVGGVAVALAGTEWAASFADGIVGANQAQLTAAFDTYQVQGAQPVAGGNYYSTAGNLARMAVIAILVIGGGVLLERRAKRTRATGHIS